MVGMSLGVGISMVGGPEGDGARPSGDVGSGSTGARVGISHGAASAVARSCLGGRVASAETDGTAWSARATLSRQRGHNPAGASWGTSAPHFGQVGAAFIGSSPRDRPSIRVKKQTLGKVTGFR